MNYVIRRDDREPNKYSRVCSCYFRDGDKRNLPTISNRNRDKLFDLLPGAEPKPPKKKVKTKSGAKLPTVRSVLAEIKENSGPSDSTDEQDKSMD